MHLGACSIDLPIAYATLDSSTPRLCASVGEQMMLSVYSYLNMSEIGSNYEGLWVTRTHPSYFAATRLEYEGYELRFSIPGHHGPQL
jgi:hypothetical protein